MIGKVINNILTSDAALTALVRNRIYPVVTAVSTILPAVVYTVRDVIPKYTKDGWAQDDCVFWVTSYATSYASAQDIASKVRTALEMKSGTYVSINITPIYMTGQDEYFMLDAETYIIKLSFTTKINSYA